MASDTLINLLAWCKRERERLQMQREMLQSGRFRIFETEESSQKDISNQHVEQIAANIAELDGIIAGRDDGNHASRGPRNGQARFPA
jgi:hypothetical protein